MFPAPTAAAAAAAPAVPPTGEAIAAAAREEVEEAVESQAGEGYRNNNAGDGGVSVIFVSTVSIRFRR